MNRLTKYLTGAAVGAAVAWTSAVVASGAGWNIFDVNWNFTNTGAFGDSFGPLSAAMAAVAAISAIAAYNGQRKEADRLKGRELDLDIRQSRSEFEKTFFNLLDAFHKIVADTDIAGGQRTWRGRDAYHQMHNKFNNNQTRLQNSSEAWSETATFYRNDLNHYFRFMYHIVNFVDVSKIEDKYFYVRLLRASLSESELVLLALNCAYGDGNEKFMPLVEQYSMLHNFSDEMKNRWKAEDIFKVEAFDSEIR